MPAFISELAASRGVPPLLVGLLGAGIIIPVIYALWQGIAGARLRRGGVVVGWVINILVLAALPLLAVFAGRAAGWWGYPVAVILIAASLWDLWVMGRAMLGRPTYGSQVLWDVCAFSYNNSIGHSIPHQTMFADLAQAIDLQPGQTLLDAGCGAGYLEKYLYTQQADVAVTAVDFSAKMLARAQGKCPGAPYTFQQVDLNAPLPFPDAAFDAVVSVQVFFALPRPEFTLGEFKRVLKPGGKLCIIDPHPGSNMGRVVVANMRTIWQRERGLRRVGKLAEAICRLPFGIVVLLLNVVMDYWVAKGEYHFDTLESLTGRIESGGFAPTHVTMTLANQDHLVVAVAAPEREPALV